MNKYDKVTSHILSKLTESGVTDSGEIYMLERTGAFSDVSSVIHRVIEVPLLNKLEKLKQLLLLADPAVSDVTMNEVTMRQWNEFLKEFPDEQV